MKEKLTAIQAQAEQAIAAAESLADLEEIRLRFLGKGSLLLCCGKWEACPLRSGLGGQAGQ